MNYYEFIVGGTAYKLKLSTRNMITLERSLGCNPLMIFGEGDRIPTVTEMVTVLHASMQRYEHGITMDTAYDIFDDWLEEGHNVVDFINEMVQIYKVSGLMSHSEKNA